MAESTAQGSEPRNSSTASIFSAAGRVPSGGTNLWQRLSAALSLKVPLPAVGFPVLNDDDLFKKIQAGIWLLRLLKSDLRHSAVQWKGILELISWCCDDQSLERRIREYLRKSRSLWQRMRRIQPPEPLGKDGQLNPQWKSTLLQILQPVFSARSLPAGSHTAAVRDFLKGALSLSREESELLLYDYITYDQECVARGLAGKVICTHNPWHLPDEVRLCTILRIRPDTLTDRVLDRLQTLGALAVLPLHSAGMYVYASDILTLEKNLEPQYGRISYPLLFLNPRILSLYSRPLELRLLRHTDPPADERNLHYVSADQPSKARDETALHGRLHLEDRAAFEQLRGMLVGETPPLIAFCNQGTDYTELECTAVDLAAVLGLCARIVDFACSEDPLARLVHLYGISRQRSIVIIGHFELLEDLGPHVIGPCQQAIRLITDQLRRRECPVIMLYGRPAAQLPLPVRTGCDCCQEFGPSLSSGCFAPEDEAELTSARGKDQTHPRMQPDDLESPDETPDPSHNWNLEDDEKKVVWL